MILVDLKLAGSLITLVGVCILYMMTPYKEKKRTKRKNLDYSLARELQRENLIRDKIHDYRLGYYTFEDFSYINEDFDVDIEKHCGSPEERLAAESELENLAKMFKL